jgi:CBS domain containing-hemolysin-like protein
VAGEFGLVAVDRNKVEQMAGRDHGGARSTLEAVKTLSFQLSGAQLGITLTSLIVGFLAEPTIGRALEPLISGLGLPARSSLVIAIAVALLLATAAEMVAGELVPKNVAIARPLPVAFGISRPLRLYNTLFRPLIVFLNAAANWTVRRLGIEPREELTGVRSLEELNFLIHSSRREGALPEEEFSLLARSLTFGGKTAADALVPRTAIVSLPGDDTLARMAEVALETGHSRFPVQGEDLDDITGIAYVKDSYRVPVEERVSTRVSEIAQDALMVPESRDLRSLIMEMRVERKHMAVVLDEFGGTAGLITLEDILEEIVGDIEDEYDPREEGSLTSSPDGVYLVSGLLHRDEVRDATGFDMPEGDYETLAGFILSLCESIPEQGDHASYGGWELKVVKMDGRRIDQVLLVAPRGEAEDEERDR